MPPTFNTICKNSKMHFWCIFNTSRECPRMHVWYTFGDSSPNLWWVIARTNRITYNSELKWPKWPWMSWSMTSIYNTSWEYPKMHVWCKFDDSSPNLWRVIARTNRISYNSESNWSKWPWRSSSMTSIFKSQYLSKVRQDAYLVPIWWF